MFNKLRLGFAKAHPKTVHCETYYNDAVYAALKEYLIKHKNAKPKVFCMTPYSYQWFHHLCNPNMSVGLLNKVMSTRVKELLALGCDIQLHVHLSQFGSLEEDEERNLVAFGKNWLKSLGAHPTKIQLGWYQESPRIKLLCGELGLKIYPRQRWHNIHDFALVNPDNFHIQQKQKEVKTLSDLASGDTKHGGTNTQDDKRLQFERSASLHADNHSADSSSLNLQEVNTDGRKKEESEKEA